MMLFLDIMVNGQFCGQIPYYGKKQVQMINGKPVAVLDEKSVRDYVIKKRPTLKYKDFTVALTEKRICRNI